MWKLRFVLIYRILLCIYVSIVLFSCESEKSNEVSRVNNTGSTEFINQQSVDLSTLENVPPEKKEALNKNDLTHLLQEFAKVKQYLKNISYQSYRECYTEYLKNERSENYCSSALVFHKIISDNEFRDSLYSSDNLLRKTEIYLYNECNIDMNDLKKSELVYFPGDSIVYERITGLEYINFNPKLLEDIIEEENGNIVVDSENRNYTLKSVFVTDCDNYWNISIESVIKDVFQLRLEREERNYEEIYYFYNNESREFEEGLDWISDYFDFTKIEEIIKIEKKKQIDAEINRLGIELLDTVNMDEYVYGTIRDAKLKLTEEVNENQDVQNENSVFYFTDTTIVFINQYGPSNGFYNFYTNIQIDLLNIRGE